MIDIIELIPSVCKFLLQQGAINQQKITEYLSQLAEGSFPIKNLAYKLFLDVIEWHTMTDHSQMRYSMETKKFWYLGQKIFNQKFLTLLKGHGRFTSHDSEINFAVPDNKTLNRYSGFQLQQVTIDQCSRVKP